MSLRPENHQRIPGRTVRTARAACPRGTPAMLIRDRLDVLVEDEEFAGLYLSDGRPGLSPVQPALLQFAENLSDRAAADEVRTRIDWKYALGLQRECLINGRPGSLSVVTERRDGSLTFA
ncbi:transposase [Streptomyces sp. NPDC058434]|uniref:transposase n=1 Tax=Streptomyces sp. NPDC058434 TaxID=3346498 RepID=UPI003649C16C